MGPISGSSGDGMASAGINKKTETETEAKPTETETEPKPCFFLKTKLKLIKKGKSETVTTLIMKNSPLSPYFQLISAKFLGQNNKQKLKQITTVITVTLKSSNLTTSASTVSIDCNSCRGTGLYCT